MSWELSAISCPVVLLLSLSLSLSLSLVGINENYVHFDGNVVGCLMEYYRIGVMNQLQRKLLNDYKKKNTKLTRQLFSVHCGHGEFQLSFHVPFTKVRKKEKNTDD